MKIYLLEGRNNVVCWLVGTNHSPQYPIIVAMREKYTETIHYCSGFWFDKYPLQLIDDLWHHAKRLFSHVQVGKGETRRLPSRCRCLACSSAESMWQRILQSRRGQPCMQAAQGHARTITHAFVHGLMHRYKHTSHAAGCVYLRARSRSSTLYGRARARPPGKPEMCTNEPCGMWLH